MARPVRPANWKEANRVGLVQPGGRPVTVGPMDVRVASVLADARRTYLELRWRPPIKAGMFLEDASLTDAMGHAIARRPECDAGTNQGEYFLAFDAVPLSATHVILTLGFKMDVPPQPITLRIDPRLRGRGGFDLAVGSAISILGRRFEAIGFRGGVTEAAIGYRLQCGPATWPVRVSATLSRQPGTMTAEAIPDAAGRIEGELVVEAPQDPHHQSLQLTAIEGFPLSQALHVPWSADEVRHAVRVDGVLVHAAVLWEAQGERWQVRIRSPQISAGGGVEVRGPGHPLLLEDGTSTEPQTLEARHWTAGAELTAQFPRRGDAPVLALRSMALFFDPPPSLRLMRG